MNKNEYFDALQELKDELGWHEFKDESVGDSQYILRKMMDLIDLMRDDIRNGI